MPKVALADSMTDWNNLIVNGERVAESIPDLGRLLKKLRAVHDRAMKLDAKRQRLEAARRECTQQLEKTKQEGKDLATTIRIRIKGAAGTKDPGLVAFGIKPRPMPRGGVLPEDHFKLPPLEDEPRKK